MKLEHQVCLLAQGQKFDELGVKAESYFVWSKIPPNPYGDNEPALLMDFNFKYANEPFYFAYSCAELGVLLPNEIIIRNTEYIKATDYGYGKWNAFYINHGISDINIKYQEAHYYEAHAKAELLIHLLEKQIIKPEKLKL